MSDDQTAATFTAVVVEMRLLSPKQGDAVFITAPEDWGQRQQHMFLRYVHENFRDNPHWAGVTVLMLPHGSDICVGRPVGGFVNEDDNAKD